VSVPEGGLEKVAAAFLEARRAARTVPAAERPAWLPDEDLGPRVAARIQSLLAGEGVSVGGVKLGAHDAAAQHALGLSGPLVAPFFDAWLFPSGTHLSLAQLVQPKIECEIGFRRHRGQWQPVACIEVADSRLGWSGRGGEVFADFALHGAIISGTGFAASDSVAFELRHDGTPIVSDVASVAAARERTERCTRNLEASYVSSGALHPMIELAPGEWALEFAGGGAATVTVDGTTDDD
jgi:hypothetical protein